MRQLLPVARNEPDLLELYAVPERGGVERPHLRLNMVESLDGVISIDGRSAGLGSPGDKRVFAVLRSLADVILVGAGTVRAERYGRFRLAAELIAARRDRGQRELPRTAVVTRSGALDWTSPLFTETPERPLVITGEAGAEAAGERAAEVADVIVAGPESVDLRRAVAELVQRGLRKILCEGGPTLNANLLAAGIIDELCLTVSPLVVQGEGIRLFNGPALSSPARFDVAHVLEEDGFMFMRLASRANVDGGDT